MVEIEISRYHYILVFVNFIVGKRGVFLRNIDEEVYREVKARAALLGITVSEAVNMALREWLRKPVVGVKGERDYLRDLAERLASKYYEEGRKGFLVVVSKREYYLCSSIEECVVLLRRLYREKKIKRSIIREVKPKSVRFIEVGGGGIEVI